MKFFETHFTHHSFKNHPHKWFLALLISPIHAAEIHYKRKYHLTFRHAKKLFVIDMTLLAVVVFLIGTLAVWRTYDPTVTKFVSLSLTADSSPDRVNSGDIISYALSYENASDVTLLHPEITLTLPPGFLLENTSREDQFSRAQRRFVLESLEPKEKGTITFGGHFYGTPQKGESLIAHLSYQQETRQVPEEKITRIITTPTGSSLISSITAPDKLLHQGRATLVLSLENSGEIPIDVRVPFRNQDGLTYATVSPSIGSVQEQMWTVDGLAPHTRVYATTTLNTAFGGTIETVSVDLTPQIIVENSAIAQAQTVHTFALVRPQMVAEAKWKDDISVVRPGAVKEFILVITNTGTIPLSDLIITLPVNQTEVQTPRVASLNQGRLVGNELTLTKSSLPTLATLAPGISLTIPVSIPFHASPPGNDLRIFFEPRVTASVDGIEEAEVTIRTQTPELSMGTQFSLAGEARYYTNEGDQLGRGSLPPQVGKQTKYWAVFRLVNTTSRVSDLRFSATLPPYVRFSGRTSVSHGADVVYTEATRTISWELTSLNPHTTAGIYLELELTPTTAQRGTTPTLIDHITASAHDTFIDVELKATHPTLNVSLPEDALAKQKGVVVE